jgi:hypothetical protein
MIFRYLIFETTTFQNKIDSEIECITKNLFYKNLKIKVVYILLNFIYVNKEDYKIIFLWIGICINH